MGFIGDMFSSGKGAGFQAQGASPEQLNAAYAQTQEGIQKQRDFVNQLGMTNGLANQVNTFTGQQALAHQLQDVANGNGPNPALAQLNQTTGANVANQAALMAGQRGSSANTGMIARQAAQQGANLQQQALGQGATLRAQQQLAGMQQLQNQQANMANMANTQVGQQQAGISALNQNQLQQQANLMGLQASANAANANIAGHNATSQGNMFGGLLGGVSSGLTGALAGGGGGAAAGGGGGLMAGGAGDAIGESGLILAANKGGQVPKYAEGGPAFNPLMQPVGNTQVASPMPQQSNSSGPQSAVGKMFNDQSEIKDNAPYSKSGGGMGDMGNMAQAGMQGLMSWGEHEALPYIGEFFSGLGSTAAGAGSLMAGGAADVGGAAAVAAPEIAAEVAPAAAMAAAKGGQVPALVSPGERYLSPEKVEEVKRGKANPIKDGQKVPGKAKVSGAKNSYANDTVRATLQEGGIVIPRSVTQSDNPEEKAMAFVRAVLAKNGHIPKRAK